MNISYIGPFLLCMGGKVGLTGLSRDPPIKF